MRYLYVLIVFVCLIAAPIQAEENSGIGFSKANLVKSKFNAGRVTMEIFTDRHVDVANLLADVDLSKPASVQTISDRVNDRRKVLYPDEEIILSITLPQDGRAAVGEEKARLVKAILWWNNTNCANCSWFAEYKSTVATMFISDIQYGAYNLYEKVGNGSYVFRYFAVAGDAATRATFGSKVSRGFRGTATGGGGRAHVVMFFFN